MKLHAGAVIDRKPGPKYVRGLRFAELTFHGPLPRPSTLTRWRQELPDDFAIALRAPRQAWLSETGTMRFDPAMENGFSWLLEAAQRLAARLIVVRTGPELTPGQRDRDRLQTYFERFPRIDGQILVWHPTGLWEADAAQEAAARMQVVGAVDALEESPPSGPVTYSTLVARGARQSFSHHDLEGVVHKLAGAGVHEAFVAIDSPRSFQEATLLQTLATKAA